MPEDKRNTSLKQNKKMKLYPQTIKEGDLKKIALLLKKGADINSQDLKGKTALWWAAFNGNLELTKFLINKKADLNISDNLSRTPLDIARDLALSGHREPDENNIHAEIVNLLAPITETIDESYMAEIGNLTKKVSKLSLLSEKNTMESSSDEPKQPEAGAETSCVIL